MRFYKLAVLLWSLALFLHRVVLSGAVPQDEFAPARFIYGAIPFLMAAAILLACGSFWPAQVSDSQADSNFIGRRVVFVLLLFAASCTQNLVLDVVLVLMGLELFWRLAGVNQEPAYLDLAARIPQLRTPTFSDLRREFWALAKVALLSWGLFGFAAGILGFIDFFFWTEPFLGQQIAETFRWDYLRSLYGYSFSTGYKLSYILCRYLLVFILAAGIFLKFRLTKRGQDRVMPELAAIGSILAMLLLFTVFRYTLGDEMNKIGLNAPLLIILCVAADYFRSNFLLGMSQVQVQVQGQTLGLCSLGLEGLSGLLKSASGPKALTQGYLKSAGILLLCFFFLYPELEDYRARVFDSFALIAVLVLAASILSVWRWPAILKRRKLTTVLIALSLSGGAFCLLESRARPDLRLIAFEYSRFGALGADSLWAKAKNADCKIGFSALDESRLAWPLPQGDAPLRSSTKDPELKKRPPIFLIVWDAARPDRASTFGYERETTPTLSELAARFFGFGKRLFFGDRDNSIHAEHAHRAFLESFYARYSASAILD